jgi:hypothetical protein
MGWVRIEITRLCCDGQNRFQNLDRHCGVAPAAHSVKTHVPGWRLFPTGRISRNPIFGKNYSSRLRERITESEFCPREAVPLPGLLLD